MHQNFSTFLFCSAQTKNLISSHKNHTSKILINIFLIFDSIIFVFVHWIFKKQTNNLFSKTNASFIRINIWFYHLKKNIETFAFFLFFGWKKSLFLTRINKHFIIGVIINIISVLIFFYQGNFSWFPSYWKNSFYNYWVCKCKLCDGITKLSM